MYNRISSIYFPKENNPMSAIVLELLREMWIVRMRQAEMGRPLKRLFSAQV